MPICPNAPDMIDETAAEIKSMHTHSSSAVATKAVDALRELLNREYTTVAAFRRDFEHNVGVLRRANPAHASLESALREIEAVVLDAEYDSVVAATDALETAIDETIMRVERAKDDAAAAVAEIIAEDDRILTHDYSTTVMAALQQLAADGHELEVIVTEARPRFLGRKTARQIARLEHIDATLTVDSAAGYHLPECDRVVTGMTCIVDKTLYNRVGTYPIAVTADHCETPVCVTGASTKVLDEGFVFENDFRAASEVLREPADGFAISNPAYDATPLGLVDQLVTDSGVKHIASSPAH